MRIIVLLLILVGISCQSESTIKSEDKEKYSLPDYQIDLYWYQGKAEITCYDLIQNRYQDEHPGKVVMVFVTEDFLTRKQVKNDHYSEPYSTGILKNNKMKHFTTGIYDYSIMTSVFTPTDRKAFPYTLKVTNSSQDWCGQTYQQLNLEGDHYKSTLHSYFEDEADRISSEKATWLEDELPTLLRINPGLLPIGDIAIIPSVEFLRLQHQPFASVKASASMKEVNDTGWSGENIKVYQIDYPEIKRKYQLAFEDIKPYKIIGWEVSYPSAFDKVVRITRAVKKAEVLTAYWDQNSLQDTTLRKQLGI